MEVCPAFVDETGVLTGSSKKQPLFGIGVLIVPNTRTITDSFYRLHFNFVQNRAAKRNEYRRELNARGTSLDLDEVDRLMWSTRHHEYKFTEVTLANIQQYVDLLNLYFSFSDLEFHCLMLDRWDPNAGLGKWNNDEWAAYNYFATELLRLRLTRNVFAIVDLQGEPDKSDVHLEDALCSVPFVKGCLRATSDMSVFLQLVDVLLGCVQFDLRSQMGLYDPGSKRGMAKRQLMNFVKGRLGIGQDDELLPDGQDLVEWSQPSTFTILKGEWPEGL